MKKTFLILILGFILITSCEKRHRNIEIIDYKNPYKFDSQIETELKEPANHPFGESHVEHATEGEIPKWKYQISSQEYNKKGNFKKALEHNDLAFGAYSNNYSEKEIDSINAKYYTVSATDYITQKSKNHQVIIINEVHHYSFHRVFTKSLLKNLFDNGYTNLGLETLSNGKEVDSLLNIRKYPILESGTYTTEPRFGDLVRQALEIGYNVFAYEDTTDADGALREIGQARNIQKLLENKPNEKVLIHCGYAHAYEGNHNAWGKAMAGRLTEYTNIDPLTIDQVKYSEKSKATFNDPLLKAVNPSIPSILLDLENKPYGYHENESWTDIAIFHPNSVYKYNRPNWLFENDNQAIELGVKDIDISFPIMILAFKKGEDINNAVPMDIVESHTKSDKIYLALKKGEYEIVVTNANGDSRKFEQIVK